MKCREIYAYIEECDNVLIASPVYFSELTGKLLDLGSRLQTYFSAKFFRREQPVAKAKRPPFFWSGAATAIWKSL